MRGLTVVTTLFIAILILLLVLIVGKLRVLVLPIMPRVPETKCNSTYIFVSIFFLYSGQRPSSHILIFVSNTHLKYSQYSFETHLGKPKKPLMMSLGSIAVDCSSIRM